MKTLSEIIKENENNKKFKYNASVVIEGHVYANSEGDAGELIDKEMDAIPGFVSGEVINIAEETTENYINNDLTFVSENTDTLEDKLKNKLKEVISMMENDVFVSKRDLKEIENNTSPYTKDDDDMLNYIERCDKIIDLFNSIQ